MDSPFKDLLRYKLKNLYDGAKTRKDNRLNLGFDYRDSLMQRNLSNHILRNQTILDFIGFLNDYMYNMLSSVKQLKQFKNYTVKKNDTNVR